MKRFSATLASTRYSVITRSTRSMTFWPNSGPAMYSFNRALVRSWRLMVAFSWRCLRSCSIYPWVAIGESLGACEEIVVSPFPVVWSETEGVAISSTGCGASVEGWEDGVIDLITRSIELSSARLGNNVYRS